MKRPNLKTLVEQDEMPYEMTSLDSMGAFMFFGEINQDTSYLACEFILKANMLLGEEIESLSMFINTEGGSVHDGFAIIDMMEMSKLPIQTIGMGLIASMGLLMLSAGQKGNRIITRNTEILAHQFSGGFYGKRHEMIAANVSHERLENQFIQHFLRHSKLSEKQIKSILFAPSDKYLTPDECKKYGLCDLVVDTFDPPKPKKQKLPSSK